MKRILHFFLPLLMIIPGCSFDEDIRSAEISPSDDGMTFVIAMPDPNRGPASYALSEADENMVETLDVFAFKKGLSGDYLLEEHAKVDASTITTDNTNTRYKSFRVNFLSLKERLYYVFVIIANGDDLIGDPAEYIGQSRDDIMEKFTVDIGGVRWINAGRNIPMWGETNEVKLENNMTVEKEVKLLRMLAKINVKVKESVQSTFELQSVRLYNYRNSGYVVPSRDNLVSTMDTVFNPTPYGDREKYPVCQIWEDLDKNVVKGCISQIYTFETEVPSASDGMVDLDLVHCVVVGGSYDEGEETYYRINFKNGDTYLDILRNHRYEINITDVKGPGYKTPGDAFKSKGMNMEADVTPWNDGDVSDIIFDGQYLLMISKAKWSFLREAQTAASTGNEVKIFTDVPGGWTIEKKVNNSGTAIDWLTLDPVKGDQDEIVNARIILEANGGATRVGYIYIRAGRLVYPIEVTQTDKTHVPATGVTLQATLTLTEGNIHQLVANVLPSDATNRSVVWSSSNEAVAYVSQDGKVTGVKTGSAVITVTTIDGGKTATCLVTVEPPVIRVTSITLTPTSLSIYMPKSITKTIKATVKPDDATYKTVTWTSTNTSIATVDQSGNVTAKAVGSTTIRATADGLTATCAVNVTTSYHPGTHKGWAGSNIYWNGSRLTFDNVGVTTNHDYQGVYFKWGSLWGLSPNNAWTLFHRVYKPGESSYSTGVGWSTIPYYEKTNLVRDDTRAILYEEMNESGGVGDICRYLTIRYGIHSKKWRMPTANEMSRWLNASRIPENWSTHTSSDADGTTRMPNTLYSPPPSEVWLPATGYRGNIGMPQDPGKIIRYWTSSPHDGKYSVILGTDGNAERIYGGTPDWASPVRCVVEED